MSEQTPNVEVSLRFERTVTFQNCEAYQNHATGELIVLSLQSGGRQEVFKRSTWAYARILYRGECVAVIQAHPAFPDYTANASQLGWTSDGDAWPTSVEFGGLSYRLGVLMRDEAHTATYADYKAGEKVLRVFND